MQKLDELAQSLNPRPDGPRARPPIDQWHPALTGDLDLVIRRDGQWLYEGKPIAREATVRLFSSILRREDDGEFYLVTPVEKWRIRVEDTPLLAHSLTAIGSGEQQVLQLTTNVGDTLDISDSHPLSVGQYPSSHEPRPLIHVAHGVKARLVTAAFYELVNLAQERELAGETVFGVMSHRKFWKIGQSG
ncbi:MAG TPA: DUF1285 domain-containing protein [Marinobacter sp.]|nr:DUF1285 domain-containing protein [Marinobacter sp.]